MNGTLARRFCDVSCLLLLLTATVSAIEPLSPQESQSSFVLHPDCRIELVASEPDVIDPVHIAFAPTGKLWVVEYSDYPNGPQDGEPGKSRIRVLSDDDGDGRYSNPVTFAEGLIFANGLMHWRDGVIVTTNGQVLFMRDTDGDDVCDDTQQWFTGFATENPQLRCNHPTFGPDNKIYIANGLRGGKIVPGKDFPWPNKRLPEPLDISGRDFRFDPFTGEYETISGNGQFGLTFDDWGNRFVCSNRNPCNHIVLEEEHLKRAPYLRVSKVFEEVSPAGVDSRLYPISRTWTTSNLHANQFTAACGVTIYRGNALPESFYGNSFTCEPTGNLVHRDILTPSGITFTSKPGREGVEFLATKDEWFRPVNLANGPDGALYVVDMYRAVIEHPQFVPDELKNRPDQMLGIDKGRIWRIVAKSASVESPVRIVAEEKVSTRAATTSDLANLLPHANAWQRETARRLLVERRDVESAPLLREILGNREAALGRVEALRALDGIGTLVEADLAPDPETDDDSFGIPSDANALGLELLRFQMARRSFHEQPVFQQHVDWFCAPVEFWLPEVPSVPRHFRIEDEQFEISSVNIQFNLRFTMEMDPTDLERKAARFTEVNLVPARSAIRQVENSVNWKAEPLLVAAGANPAQLCELLVLTAAKESQPFRTVAVAAGRKNDTEELVELLHQLLTTDGIDTETFGTLNRAAMLAGLSEGLPGGRVRFRELLQKLPDDEQRQLDDLIGRNFRDLKWPVDIAFRLLAMSDGNDSLQSLLRVLHANRSPEQVQLSIAALEVRPEAEAGTALAEALPRLSPSNRNQAIAALATRPERIHLLLDLIENGQLPALAIDQNIAKRLMAHADLVIKEKAVRLLKQAPPEDRVKVLAEYQSCLTLESDPVRGKQVFVKNCAQCHKVGDVGVDVAPDISDSRTKTPEYLLTNILDPNRAIDNNFFSYTVVDTDGVIHTGILASETGTSVTLKQPEGKTVSFGRADIEAMKNNGVSLMPVGLEKTVPPQDMADVISFIKNWRYLDGLVPKEVIR
ncbi:MAG: c-type cytochrome [Planctomycetaceae bacterium]